MTQTLVWVGAVVVTAAVLVGASKLLAEVKSAKAAPPRPRRPWEVLP
jgi:hypothetical protein